ncbi:MAG TPA: hypothetical protein VIU87_08730 [Mycobacterium sp.]
MATDTFSPMMARYVTAAQVALDPSPSRVITFQPGEEVAWDECCEGQLWCRIIRVGAGSYRGKADGTVCDIPYWTLTLGLGVIRCVGVLDDNGTAPTAARISADGLQANQDIAALSEVITCIGLTTGILGWIPLGPQGGCAGGEWQFETRVAVCACPPERYPVQ